MQVMAGKVDDANLQAKKPSEDISLLKEDLERRLTALEGKINNLEKISDEQQKKMAESSAKQAELSPEALYQQGLDLVKGGDTQKGRELLTKFVEKNPNHELAANARKADQKLRIANGLCLTGGDVSDEFKSLLKDNYDARSASRLVARECFEWTCKSA